MQPSDRSSGALKWGSLAAAAICALALAYSAFWFTTAAQVKTGIAGWIEARRADGYAVSLASMEISGFPFLIRARVDKPAIFAPGGADAWQWEAPSLVLEARPWSLTRVTGHFFGHHRLALQIGRQRREITIEAMNIDGTFTIGEGWARRARLTATALTLRHGNAPLAELANFDLSIGHDPSPSANHRKATLDVALKVTGFGLDPALDVDLPFGPKVRAFALAAQIMGRIPAERQAVALALWRDDGGTVEVKHLDLSYGPLKLQGSGTAAVDGRLQPVGAFTARIEGLFEASDALRRRGIIRERDSIAAKIILGVLSKKGVGGAAATLSAPLTIQDRRLFIGPVPLLRIPEVHW
jgi:hypothetical protein